MGNIGLMMLIKVDPHLQTPTYFFLSNLSFVDLCYSSVIVTNILVNLLSQNKSISYHSCALQFYFFCTFAIPNPLSWLPWRMTAMSPSVTLYCTRLWCLGASAYGWSSCHTLEAIWVPWCTHPLRLLWNTLRKMSLIIFSVTSVPCLSYCAQTRHLMSGFSPHRAAQWKLSTSSFSSSPTFTFSCNS